MGGLCVYGESVRVFSKKSPVRGWGLCVYGESVSVFLEKSTNWGRGLCVYGESVRVWGVCACMGSLCVYGEFVRAGGLCVWRHFVPFTPLRGVEWPLRGHLQKKSV